MGIHLGRRGRVTGTGVLSTRADGGCSAGTDLTDAERVGPDVELAALRQQRALDVALHHPLPQVRRRLQRRPQAGAADA